FLVSSFFIFTHFSSFFFFFFFNAPSPSDIYTLSLHDALPIWFFCVGLPVPLIDNMRSSATSAHLRVCWSTLISFTTLPSSRFSRDRKSTRLNSSHLGISYAVFCLKKKKNI